MLMALQPVNELITFSPLLRAVENMSLFASYLALGAGLILAALSFSFAIKLARADRIESKKSAARSRSMWDAIRGRARTHEDWIPDARVKGGMIYDKKNKRLEISGRLSDDSFDRVFRS
jgi:hypothetical protein